ncbi:MAG: stage II sporulation protein P [Oscillibacter sp.]|nr:stage II sporulation protein P [Oscillibacter sp.]
MVFLKRERVVFKRLGALALSGCILYLVSVTAGTKSAAAALDAIRASAPEGALRWELGDLWFRDELSVATVMAIAQSPLLMSARAEVAALWSKREDEPAAPAETEEDTVIVPVEETPLVPDTPTDNGVEGRTLVPTSPEGYLVSGLAYISNSTDYTVTSEEVSQPFAASLGEGAPQILIIHTHGSESYTPAETEGIVWSGDHRTTDSRYNVVAAGDAMAEVFSAAGISVLHDRTLYDYPSYNDAYDRSLTAIKEYLAEYPSIRFVLDVHRDAIEDAEGNQYKVVCETEEGTSAQMTLVMGSDGGGLEHPNWRENLRLAAAVQNTLLEENGQLMRPILLRNSRYNQHATTGSLLVEVGAAGNSPEEAALAARLFARGMVEVLTR